MAVLPRWLRLPRPTTFLYLMSLRTGVEMISLSLLFNRIAGLFGLLAILTGFQIDATQLSMYLYSVAALVLLAFLMPHIRKQSPMECLGLAWFYALDTLINCTYTIVFALTWFMTVSAASADTHGSVPSSTPGSGTIDDTAGFTSPKYNVSEVDVIKIPSTGIAAGQDAVAVGTAAAAAVVTTSTSLQHGVQLVESIPSLVAIIILSLVRVYFVLVMMAYAKQVLYQYMQTASSAREHQNLGNASGSHAENPFGPDMPLGQGWRGKLGRIMVSVAREYFLNGPADDGWAKGVNSRFKTSSLMVPNGPQGTLERERRARSGTGPPRPAPDLTKLEV